MVPGLIVFLLAFTAHGIDDFLPLDDIKGIRDSPIFTEEIPINQPRASHRIGWFKIENGLDGDWSQEILFPRDFYACGIRTKTGETSDDLAIKGNKCKDVLSSSKNNF